MKKDNFGARVLLTALAAMSPNDHIFEPRIEQPPKNKYNLTDEELVMMETMTPKQKKAFLKERK